MQPRLSVLSLGVRDVERARAFYIAGLGWPEALRVPGEVVFVQIGHGLLLSLWDAEALKQETAGGAHAAGPPPVSLSHNVAKPEEVASVLEQAVVAGATLVRPAETRPWGGVSGYFADPDGFRWEVAHNPGLVVADDGNVTLVAINP